MAGLPREIVLGISVEDYEVMGWICGTIIWRAMVSLWLVGALPVSLSHLHFDPVGL